MYLLVLVVVVMFFFLSCHFMRINFSLNTAWNKTFHCRFVCILWRMHVQWAKHRRHSSQQFLLSGREEYAGHMLLCLIIIVSESMLCIYFNVGSCFRLISIMHRNPFVDSCRFLLFLFLLNHAIVCVCTTWAATHLFRFIHKICLKTNKQAKWLKSILHDGQNSAGTVFCGEHLN